MISCNRPTHELLNNGSKYQYTLRITVRPELVEGSLSKDKQIKHSIRSISTLMVRQGSPASQFDGMVTIAFSYEDFEQTRLKLISEIHTCLTDADKDFILSVNRLEPDWGIYDFQDFPSVKWKLANLATFKEKRPEDHQQHCTKLEKILSSNL